MNIKETHLSEALIAASAKLRKTGLLKDSIPLIDVLLTVEPTTEDGCALISQDGISPSFNLASSEASEYVSLAIQDSVRKYTRNKDNAISVYKAFLNFISTKYGIELKVQFPQYKISSSLERQMAIVRLLQDPEISLADLESHLWVSERTIQDDLKQLKPDSDDPLQVMGQTLAVDWQRHKRDISFRSNVHPLFLTFNLTQVIATLEGLKHMSEKRGWQLYALNSAKVIWRQLSVPARKRIAEVSVFMSLDYSWYEKLNDPENKQLFMDEWICSNDTDANSVILCVKNGKRCDIQYQGDDGETVILDHCKVVDYGNDKVSVLMNGIRLELVTGRILASKSSAVMK